MPARSSIIQCVHGCALLQIHEEKVSLLRPPQKQPKRFVASPLWGRSVSEVHSFGGTDTPLGRWRTGHVSIDVHTADRIRRAYRQGESSMALRR